MLDRKAQQNVAKETKTLTKTIIQSTTDASADSTIYTQFLESLRQKPQAKQTRVCVQNADIFTAAQRILSSSPHPRLGVLNLASEYHAGGGWLRGSLAQEEALCLCSTLAATLDPSYYPFATPTTAIWSPGVAVFREEVSNDCRIFEPQERFVVSVVSVTGLRHSELSSDEQDYCEQL